MTPERWEEAGKLYDAALELPPAQRPSFLDDACRDDQALRQEVESLLAAEDGAGSFLAAGAMNDAAKMFSEDEKKTLLLVGKRLNHYQVLSLLGAGGMGQVYLAEDIRLKRKVALKLLPAELTANRDRLRRFEQEARAASALNHPNIITIHEIGQVNGVNFIVTEFIEGQTLRQLMATARMQLSLVLDVATQVASALTAAHAAGIVHRDLKPENIMLRPDGLIKVLDFGLAKLTESRPSNVESEAPTVGRVDTEMGTVMGTAQYMSPEQARGLKVDARTDIFSLGVVLYEMLAGRVPFAGETTADIISVLIHKEPQPLSTLAPDMPAELQHIVSKALRKDRDERYQTVKSLLGDLRTLKQELDFAAKLERSAPADSKGAAAKYSGQATATPAATENAETQTGTARPTSSAEYLVSGIKQHRGAFAVGLAVLLFALIGLVYWLYDHPASNPAHIESIAVLPFVNETGNSEAEYLSDGMTETLINGLSQLPNLSVKARSSVFRYKGKEIEPQKIAADLSVQAILNGRVVQRGDELTLYLSLVEGRTGNQLWGAQYNRKLTDLVTLQNEIARDVSQKLRLRLSGADEQRLAKNYTDNTEAYELYLKGRYHLHKLTPPEIQTSISYFQQAIDIDPSYALAYVGLADAYRSFGLVGDRSPGEFFPKAKAAAQKAIEIDDTLAEAHAELGFTIFWYDWDWNAAEKQLKRALELDPNNADNHLFYAHLLSNTGRHAEGLAEVKRARELDPLDLRINGLEAQFLIHAGKADEGLAILQNPSGLNANSWFAHMFASSAYIEKGMFAEAVIEGRKAKELNVANSQTTGTLAYALAKSGKQAEARGLLEELLRLSTQRYVSPGNIALVYNGLDERDETFAWLERGFKERDQKMVFLKVEPKWNNLRADPRFQDLLRRVGF
jgi:serine/threonine protein kinase/TolB-like protein/Tfp pilus assembly protein PilF